MKTWINPLGSRKFDFVNKRAGSSVRTDIVGRLESTGELVNYTEVMQNEGNHTWYLYENAGQNFYMRSDVHGRFIFEQDSFTLNVPYFNQNAINANLSVNDCGPASSSMLLAYDGVDVTISDFMTTAGISGNAFTSFNQNMVGIQRYGYTPVFERPGHLARILQLISNNIPVFVLVHYDHLFAGKNYGHFLVAVGWEILGDQLYIICHDPNRRKNMTFVASQFAAALAYIGSTDNMPFQIMYIGDYKNLPADDFTDNDQGGIVVDGTEETVDWESIADLQKSVNSLHEKLDKIIKHFNID